MHERLAEITGFTCRWCLLALAATAVLAASWTGLRGASPVATGLRADVAPADVLCLRHGQEAARLTLHYANSPAQRDTSHVLIRLPDGTQLTDRRYRQDMSWVDIPRVRAGLVELRTVGLPYGPVAFRRGRPIVLVTPRAGQVFLIDAHLAMSASGPAAAMWRLCAQRMARTRPTAFFFIGSVGEYRDAKARLRRMHPGVPVEYAGPSNASLLIRLANTAKALNPYRIRGRPKPIVVTGQPDLAVQVARRRHFPAHMVGRTDPPLESHALLTQHASLAELLQWLAAGTTRPGAGR